MDVAQYFETTITDCESGIAFRAVAIPGPSMATSVRGDLIEWASLLGLRSVALLHTAEEIERVLASLLRADDPAAAEFAHVALREAHIPISEAGTVARTLLEIAQSAGVSLASVVSLVSLSEARLLLVAVPAGVVICGSAASMDAALAGGMATRLREVMGLDGRRQSAGPGPQAG